MNASVRVLLFSLFAPCVSHAETPTTRDQKNPDPIVGNWRWGIFSFTVEIAADGTFLCSEKSLGAGVWKFIPASSIERKYQLSWRNGAVVDSLTLSRDGKKLAGKNNKGEKFSAQRVE